MAFLFRWSWELSLKMPRATSSLIVRFDSFKYTAASATVANGLLRSGLIANVDVGVMNTGAAERRITGLMLTPWEIEALYNTLTTNIYNNFGL